MNDFRWLSTSSSLSSSSSSPSRMSKRTTTTTPYSNYHNNFYSPYRQHPSPPPYIFSPTIPSPSFSSSSSISSILCFSPMPMSRCNLTTGCDIPLPPRHLLSEILEDELEMVVVVVVVVVETVVDGEEEEDEEVLASYPSRRIVNGRLVGCGGGGLQSDSSDEAIEESLDCFSSRRCFPASVDEGNWTVAMGDKHDKWLCKDKLIKLGDVYDVYGIFFGKNGNKRTIVLMTGLAPLAQSSAILRISIIILSILMLLLLLLLILFLCRRRRRSQRYDVRSETKKRHLTKGHVINGRANKDKRRTLRLNLNGGVPREEEDEERDEDEEMELEVIGRHTPIDSTIHRTQQRHSYRRALDSESNSSTKSAKSSRTQSPHHHPSIQPFDQSNNIPLLLHHPSNPSINNSNINYPCSRPNNQSISHPSSPSLSNIENDDIISPPSRPPSNQSFSRNEISRQASRQTKDQTFQEFRDQNNLENNESISILNSMDDNKLHPINDHAMNSLHPIDQTEDDSHYSSCPSVEEPFIDDDQSNGKDPSLIDQSRTSLSRSRRSGGNSFKNRLQPPSGCGKEDEASNSSIPSDPGGGDSICSAKSNDDRPVMI